MYTSRLAFFTKREDQRQKQKFFFPFHILIVYESSSIMSMDSPYKMLEKQEPTAKLYAKQN